MKIEEIKKIKLEEGDVLAVRLPEDSTRGELEGFQKGLQRFFPNNNCLVYTREIDFTKIQQ
jgi:hypothetical protein